MLNWRAARAYHSIVSFVSSDGHSFHPLFILKCSKEMLVFHGLSLMLLNSLIEIMLKSASHLMVGLMTAHLWLVSPVP